MSRTVPTSTYRLHLTHAFDLRDAAALVDHTRGLGVDWLYLSPIQQVPAGAEHGYHVLEPGQVDPQLGGRQALEELSRLTGEQDRGLMLDIVPNHLAASPDNPRWTDLLRHGPDSAHASTFDVDLGTPEFPRPVVLPVLDRPLEQALADGLVRVVRRGSEQSESEQGEQPVLLVGENLRLPLADHTDPDAPIEEVLAAQHYELRHWLDGDRLLNWRRFFAVNELVGVRVEDPEVFADTHRLILGLVEQGVVRGLRVDHIDGLADPHGYLQRLRTALGDGPWLVVEKILELHEPLPSDWPVDGTTGYEVATLLGVWLTDLSGYDRLREAFAGRTGMTGPVTDDLAGSKREIVGRLFAGDLQTVQELLNPVSGVPDDEVEAVLADLVAHLQGYRTYAPPEGPIPRDSRHRLEEAIEAARLTHGPGVGAAVGDALLADRGRPALIRLQQLTGAVTAKGFEDRLLYRHVALSSLCEVGVDAHVLDDPPKPQAVVEALAERQRAWPLAGTTTSTHDTKRAEDVRARIAVLSELPDAFLGLLDQLAELVDPPVDAHPAWLLVQAGLGMLDLEDTEPSALTTRLQAYAVKALREAGLRTTHRDPDEEFEASVVQWVQALTEPGPGATALRAFADRIAIPGASNALAQVLLKLVGPGVPDIYRGTEIWDASLVDPDNRRPLPLARIREVSEGVRTLPAGAERTAAVDELRERWRDGRVKLHLTREGLLLRQAHPELFAAGGIDAPPAHGSHATHVAALRRRHPSAPTVVGVATRLPYGLAGSAWPVGSLWEGTAIEVGPGGWTDVLTSREMIATDGMLQMDQVLAHLPVAILVSDDRH